MIIPARGKVLVEIYSQRHSLIHLPEAVTRPELSVAEVIINNNRFNKGQLVLIPTKAGLVIKQGNVKYRLINELDIVAELSNDG